MRKPTLMVLACAALFGCASVTPQPQARTPTLLQMPGTDAGQAAALLGAYLVARGYTVGLEGDAAVAAADPAGAAFTLEVLLDPTGLDRLVLSRSYPVKEGVDPGLVPAFASELNGALNVGVFSAYPPGILFQASLPFLDDLDPALLDAFIAFTAEVGIAVRQVEAGRGLLVEVEGGSGSG
jgi:hypothetical protein